MTDNGWKQEYFVLLIFFILSVITGLITAHWALGFLLWLMAYVIWKIMQFRTFYNWFMKGSSKKHIPENHGVFESLICKVISNKNQTKAAQKHSKYLLQQFVTTAQALPFATLLLNHRFEIQWVNNAAHDILNISDSDMATRIDNIIRVPKFVKMLSTGEKDQEIKLQHGHDNKSIQIRLIEINKVSYLLVARDISAQEALQKSRKAFVANASHELRTPLTVISGYLEMLQLSGHLQGEWSDAISQASNQADRMASIIDGMLELSKIEHDKVLETQDVKLGMPELLNGLYNDIRNSADAKQHNFSAEIDSSLNLKGNVSEITSICLNLMHNAINHTPQGTDVMIKWFKQNGEANFLVVDNGPGIDTKHIQHLTERFYRVDNSKMHNQQSTGLGLAIVKHICLKHGASLVIESEPGKGSTFKVVFPGHRTFI